MIDAGHTAIFQWIAVYVASGIGVIELVIGAITTKEKNRLRIIYGIIYPILVSVMTLSFYDALNVMHLQNGWANKLPIDQQNMFYQSRSWLSSAIVDRREFFSFFECKLIFIHILLFAAFGFLVWILAFKKREN